MDKIDDRWGVCLLIMIIALIGLVVGWTRANNVFIAPSIPHCKSASDVIIGNGEYNPKTSHWSEYHCVSVESESKSIYPSGGSDRY